MRVFLYFLSCIFFIFLNFLSSAQALAILKTTQTTTSNAGSIIHGNDIGDDINQLFLTFYSAPHFEGSYACNGDIVAVTPYIDGPTNFTEGETLSLNSASAYKLGTAYLFGTYNTLMEAHCLMISLAGTSPTGIVDYKTENNGEESSPVFNITCDDIAGSCVTQDPAVTIYGVMA